MEASLKRELASAGIMEGVVSVLEEELILSSTIFYSLREEHFEKLLPRLKVGQRALLLRLWDSSNLCAEVGHLQSGDECKLR